MELQLGCQVGLGSVRRGLVAAMNKIDSLVRGGAARLQVRHGTLQVATELVLKEHLVELLELAKL